MFSPPFKHLMSTFCGNVAVCAWEIIVGNIWLWYQQFWVPSCATRAAKPVWRRAFQTGHFGDQRIPPRRACQSSRCSYDFQITWICLIDRGGRSLYWFVTSWAHFCRCMHHQWRHNVVVYGDWQRRTERAHPSPVNWRHTYGHLAGTSSCPSIKQVLACPWCHCLRLLPTLIGGGWRLLLSITDTEVCLWCHEQKNAAVNHTSANALISRRRWLSGLKPLSGLGTVPLGSQNLMTFRDRGTNHWAMLCNNR